jgi:fructoselysine-6-phosphate deglycase
MDGHEVQGQATLPAAPQDFEATLERCLDQAAALDELAGDAVRGGLDSVFLVGCGGSLFAGTPAQFLLERRASGFRSFHLTSNEFNFRRPAALGERSLVVTLSHTGRTPETVAAVETARTAGARVVAFTREDDSPLATAADQVFTYGSADTVTEAKHVLLGQLAWALLRHTGVEEDYEAQAATYAALPAALAQTQVEAVPYCEEVAAQCAEAPITYVLGSGPSHGSAAGLAMCYMQEMLWLHTAAFNAGEYFHGAFEVTTDDVPVVVFVGEDATRAMGERAARFVRRYTKKALVLDTREFSLPGIDDAWRSEVSPFAVGTVVPRIAAHLAFATNHSLDNRRYMFRVEY